MSVRVFAVAASLLLCGALPVWSQVQSQGIRANFTITRTVPIEEVVVMFTQLEHIATADDVLASQAQVLINALKAEGVTVKTWTTSFNTNPNPAGPTMNNGNKIGEAPPAAAINLLLNYSFTVTGFKRVEDVLAVFVKNGVRQVTNILLRQSDPNKIYDELAAEAIQGALARGRKMATLAGMTNLEVADININPMPNAFPNPGVNQGQSAISRTATGETGMFVGMTATVLLALPKSAK